MPYTFLRHHHGLNENHPPLTAKRRCTSPAQLPRSPPRLQSSPSAPIYPPFRLRNSPLNSQPFTRLHSTPLHYTHSLVPRRKHSTTPLPHLTSLNHFSLAHFQKEKNARSHYNPNPYSACYAVLLHHHHHHHHHLPPSK